MFGSRVSWLSWFRAYAECNPYTTRFSAAVQLALYCTLELPADNANACTGIARLAITPRPKELVTMLELRAYLTPTRSESFASKRSHRRSSQSAVCRPSLYSPSTPSCFPLRRAQSHASLFSPTRCPKILDDFLPAPARARLNASCATPCR